MIRNLIAVIRDWLDPDRIVCRFPRLTDQGDE